MTSTFLPEPTATDRILRDAARHWGDPDLLAGVSTLYAVNRARGPGGEFRVTVCYARDGRAWIRFEDGLSAGIWERGTWMIESPGSTRRELTLDLESFVRGHEVHMNMLDPGTRYGPLHYSGTGTFAGQAALRLVGFDALGEAAEFFYARKDSTPQGYRAADHLRHGDPATIEVGDWDSTGPLRLFRRATFRQGSEEFCYRYTEI